MISLAFPNMFTSYKTLTVSDNDATANNLQLLLSSEKCSLLGDPFFGTQLRQVIYSQNSVIIKDLIIDQIYSAITTFMPQLKVTRDKIKVTGKDTYIEVQIEALNTIDYTINLYKINLTDL